MTKTKKRAVRKKTISVTPSTTCITISFNKVNRKGAVKEGKKLAVPRSATQLVLRRVKVAKKAKK